MIKEGQKPVFRALVVVAAVAVALAGCGSSAKKAATSPTSNAIGGSSAGTTAATAACTGAPINLMTIEPLTSPIQHEPQIPDAATAAANAVTKSCQLGRPVRLISCDDHYDPNQAQACGREAVADHVLAIVGTTSAFAANFLPITTAAGIPDVGDLSSSTAQLTGSMVYPLQNPVTLLTGFAATAKSLGAKKVAVVGINVSAAATVINAVGNVIQGLGMQYASPILVPPTATDMTQYAQQALTTGAGAILPVLPAPDTLQLIKALSQAGADFTKTYLISGGTVIGPQEATALGKAANGVLVVQNVWPSTDNSNPGIKRYNSEMDAAGYTGVDRDASSVIAWSSVHIIADLLQGSASIDSATLIQKLNTDTGTGSNARPELAPFNFTTNAFPNVPAYSKLRAFSNEAVVTELINGALKPVTNSWVNYTNTFPITLAPS